MTMYGCVNCGEESGTFPQVIIHLNNKIDYDNEYNNEFENEFNSLKQEVADYLHVDVTTVERYHISTVWERFSEWLDRTHSVWFCSFSCAKNWLMNKELEYYG